MSPATSGPFLLPSFFPSFTMASVDRTPLSGHTTAGSNRTAISTTLKTCPRSLIPVKVTWSILLALTACCLFMLIATRQNTTVWSRLYTSLLPFRNSRHVVSTTKDTHRNTSFLSSDTNNKSWPVDLQQIDVYMTDSFKTFVSANNFSSVLEYLVTVNSYLLTFRSPFIRETPSLHSWPETDTEKKQREERTSRRKLLVWYNAPPHVHGQFKEYQFDHCPVKECNISFDYVNDHAKADAVVFLPGAGTAMPPRDHADQVYIFYTMESPWYTSNDYRYTPWNRAFNWTWNFRLGSDIFSAVRYLKRSSSPPSHNALLKMKRQKKKSVAWMVSHCGVQSKRDEYVHKLRKIIPVDIYGSCGELSCERWAIECDLLLNDYLFYLSFENSMCVDYVTEKFYKTFKEGVHVLPVVRGGANYSRYFPEGTFIDAEAFSGPEELGRYLLELAQDEARYVDMLWRRAHFVFHEHGYIDAHCQLCYKLHYVQRFRKTYSDMNGWYHKGGCTFPKPF